MIRYQSSRDQNRRTKICLISGEKEFKSHVVVLLGDVVLDSNVGEAMPKKEYDERMRELNKGLDIFSEEYNPKPSKEELLRICEKCGLSRVFREGVRNALKGDEKKCPKR